MPVPRGGQSGWTGTQSGPPSMPPSGGACVSERKREREREREGEGEGEGRERERESVCVCFCVCEGQKRQGDREKECVCGCVCDGPIFAYVYTSATVHYHNHICISTRQ